MYRFFKGHKTFILSMVFLVVFSVTVSYATPPAQPFNPGQTLDPSCAPGESNCTVAPISIGGTVVANATPSSVLFTDSTNHLTSTGTVPLAQGGTGANDASTARNNLGISFATNSEVQNDGNIAVWGDSLTAANYPAYLATLSGFRVYNGGVPGETSTQIAGRMLAATDKHSWPTIIWAGRNNYTDPTTVKSDIAAMVASLSSGTPYIIIGILNGDTANEYQGQSGYNTIVQLNNELATVYGSHFIDMRTYLVSLYNPSIPQDVIDHGNDIPPSSLRTDFLHMNEAGYRAVADKVYQNIGSFQASTEKILTTKNFYSLFSSLASTQMNYSNTASGQGALNFNTTGTDNIAFGYRTLYYNTTGSNNNAVGSRTLYYNTTGINNNGIGLNVLYSNTTGSNNTGSGGYALYLNTTGGYNVAYGTLSMYTNTTGSHSAAFGSSSLYSNTTGTNNTALGDAALYSNVDGSSNTASGQQAMYSNTSGANNTANGYHALYFNTTGGNNTALGRAALTSATTASSNTAIGSNSLINNVTGGNNVAVGNDAGRGAASNSISNSTLIGYRAGYASLTGANNNILIGYQAGDAITTGAHNLVIGYDIDAPSATASNQLTIGNAIFGTSISGTGTTISTGNLGLFVAAPTARLQLPGGATGAGTAALKFSTGNLLTTTEGGAVEYDGTHLYFTATDGGIRYQLDQQSGSDSYTFSTGITNTAGTITNDLVTGITGGQSVIGGTGSGDNLTLVSTTNATKGKIIFGASGVSAYDGTTGFLGVGTASPTAHLSISGNISAANWTTSGIALSVPAATFSNTTSSGTIAALAVTSFGSPTLTATSATTYTTAANVYISGAPIASTNVTIATPYSLQVASGNTLLSGNLTTAGSVSTSATALNSNLYVGASTGFISTGTAQYLFAGASTIAFRTAFFGGSSTTASVGTSYSGVLVASAPITTAASGTHTLLANMVINPIGTVTSGGAAITNTASLYVGGASTAGTNNYALWVASGLSQFGSASVTTGTTIATFQNAGGTCSIVPSTSGAISCSSDMNLKKNITTLADGSSWSYNTNIAPVNQSTLTKVLALTPVAYNWNVENNTDPKHAGFIAQEVRQVFPDLVMEDPQTHLLSLSYSGMIPYTIEALQEMNLNVTDIANLDRPNTWREALVAWLGSATNGIAEIFAKKVTTDQLNAQKICVGSSDNQVCITKDQLQQLLQGNNGGNSSAPQTTTVIGNPTDDTPPATGDTSTQTPTIAPVEPVASPVPAENSAPSPTVDEVPAE